jgi:hypothetical protein
MSDDTQNSDPLAEGSGMAVNPRDNHHTVERKPTTALGGNAVRDPGPFTIVSEAHINPKKAAPKQKDEPKKAEPKKAESKKDASPATPAATEAEGTASRKGN